MRDVIKSTVIERSMLGQNAEHISTIFYVASLAIPEFGITCVEPEGILAEVLGIPVADILDEASYRKIMQMLTDYPGEYLFPYWGRIDLNRCADRFYDSLREKTTPVELFIDFLAIVSAPQSATDGFAQLSQIADIEDLELSEEILSAATQCLRARARRSMLSEGSLDAMDGAAFEALKLQQLIDTSSRFYSAPLGSGGAQHVAAVLTTGADGVLTLTMIGTVSMAARMMQKLAQANNTLDSPLTRQRQICASVSDTRCLVSGG